MLVLTSSQGAGWITEAPRNASDAFLAWMIQYEPLIRALEHHEHKGQSSSDRTALPYS